MSNLCIELNKMNDKGFMCVYDIIQDEYNNNKLTTYDDEYTMYAYFFQLSNISKTKLKLKDMRTQGVFIRIYQFLHMLK